MTIPWQDYVDFAPNGVGEQVSINHTSCTAGEDTRGRLYVKRVSDSLLVAYCHNCGEKGHYVDGYSNVDSYRWRDSGDGGATKEEKALFPTRIRPIPGDCVFATSLWPRAAVDFVRGFDSGAIWGMRISYSPTLKRLVIPFYSSGGLYCGYQTRRVLTEDVYPKYLSYLDFGNDATRFYTPYSAEPSSSVVICEDVLSAYRLFIAGYSPYCLCGANFVPAEFVHESMMHFHGLPPTSLYVWLDNDNASIRRKAAVIANSLRLVYTVPVKVIQLIHQEPKRLTVEQVRNEILHC